MARLPLIVQNERRKRIGLAITIWLQMCTVANWFLVALGELKSSRNMLVDEQVAMFLHIISYHLKNRVIKHHFNRSGETVSRSFHNVLNAVICLQDVLFKKAEPITANSTDPRWKWFKNCLGALDGTHIKIRVPTVDKPRYRTRKGDIATNMLGVCTPDMQFVYVLPGWEGSVADGRVLRDAISRRHGLKVPHGCYYLVDAGYTNCEGFLAPFRGQRYHLNEWRQGYQPSTPEEFFNMKHASARNVIERCFGLLKLRWGILRSPSFYPVRVHNRIIIACCLLHNFIRTYMSLDPIEEELGEGLPSNVIDDDEPNIINIHPSDAWATWRMELANQISRGTKRKWVPEEDAALVACMVDLHNARTFNADTGFKGGYLNELEKMIEKVLPNAMLKAKPNLKSRIRTLKRDWSIVYDMLSGKNNSGFGWDEHSHKEAAQFRHRSFPYYDQLTAIYAKDRATGKDAQTAADIIEEINVENVAATNSHEERNDFHGSEADVSLDDMDLSATQPQPEPQLARNQGDSAFSKKKKKISDASDFSTSFNDAAALLAENIRTVGLEISKSIASEVVIQQKSEMTIQESALKLYPTLCEVEGLTEDERYRALSKIPDHPTQMLIFLVYLLLCDWNGSEDFLLTIKNHGYVDILITFCVCNIWMV
ncbi:hypothetical protein CXB51_013698 [Gossypium anomalum]|uniref:Myb/SANT-like domain-containing protein n=1 Tax=Gossypium anomalum TaxID=47600 RepID=A0A8J5Z8E0_9ROSI|nr:hypothetical protein CXB51_013698 [Gossypium anomalum]